MTKLKRKAISIPLPLFERISSRARQTGFSSESDYATYILREAMQGLEKKNKEPSKEASEVFRKLKALGYI